MTYVTYVTYVRRQEVRRSMARSEARRSVARRSRSGEMESSTPTARSLLPINLIAREHCQGAKEPAWF